MSKKHETAISKFQGGFNCAQAVCSVFSEKYGLDNETALKISCGLGGGLRSGEVCGAVSAAVLVVGLKHGQFIADDIEAKTNCNEKTVEFLAHFKEKHQTIICRELLGIDTSIGDGRKQAMERNLFRLICDDLVKSAISILEELGY